MNAILSRIEAGIRHYASVPVAAIGVVLLYLFLTIGYRSLLGPITGAAIGGLLAIILLHVVRPGMAHTEPSLPDYRVAGIITCLYVISIFLMYRFVLYERPVAHYIAFGGFAGYIAYEIALGAQKSRVIPQILVLLFFTYWSVQLAFPAGMNQADTRSTYLPIIREAIDSGIVDGPMIYLGHMIYATESILITGMSPQTGYFLLTVLLLTGTMLVISVLDMALPSLSRQVVLYAALFFGCMSWTLGRGFHPSKLSFFYALTLLLGMVCILLYTTLSPKRRRMWALIGIVVGPALIFGHQFSAGAALLFVVAITIFVVAARFLYPENSAIVHTGPTMVFVAAYLLGILGNPIHSDGLAGRIAGLIASVFLAGAEESGGGGTGGAGRYSELPLETLFAATSGEAILFGLGVLGAAIAIRRTNWEFDLVIFWMGFIAVFLVISLVFNAGDTQPQRFHALLGIFGLNIFAGVTLVYLLRSDIPLTSPKVIGAVVCVFAVVSLASPVASVHLSIISDELPHNRLHDTNQLNAGEEWADTYEGNPETMLRTMPPDTEVPYEPQTTTTVAQNTSEIEPGYRYGYVETAAETGIRDSTGQGIGGHEYVFLLPDTDTTDSVIYSNGETTIRYKTENATAGGGQ